MGEELFNVLQRYGLVDGSQKFDLGELVVKADDSFVIPDPTIQLAAIAEEADDIAKQIGVLNGTITGLDTKIAALNVAIASATDSEVKKELEAQKEILIDERSDAIVSRAELVAQGVTLAGQLTAAQATATRLGVENSPQALAAAQNITDLQDVVAAATDETVDGSVNKLNTTLENKEFKVPETTATTTTLPPVSSEREFPTIPGRRGGDQSILDKRNAARREYEA
jgi:hypothetical protein